MAPDREGPQFLLRVEFDQAMKGIERTLGGQDKELSSLRLRVHDIANACARIPLIEMDMGKLSEAIEKVPRKEDLEYVTRSMETSFKNLEKDRLASERRMTRNIALISFVASTIISLVVILVNALKH